MVRRQAIREAVMLNSAQAQEQCIRQLVGVLSGLAAESNCCPPDAQPAPSLLVLAPAEREDRALLVEAAGRAFIVPGNPFCSLLAKHEYLCLRRKLEAWDELPFHERALVKEAFLLLSRIPNSSCDREGDSSMREMATQRWRLGL